MFCLAIHDNKLYSGCGNKAICIWNTENYEQIATLKVGSGYFVPPLGHTGWVNCITFHDNKLYSGCGDGTIRIWVGTHPETYEEIAILRENTDGYGYAYGNGYGCRRTGVMCLTIHKNRLFSGNVENTISVWKV